MNVKRVSPTNGMDARRTRSGPQLAARVSQKVGQTNNPASFLLMHTMGTNVAGVIGAAVAAGIMISLPGH